MTHRVTCAIGNQLPDSLSQCRGAFTAPGLTDVEDARVWHPLLAQSINGHCGISSLEMSADATFEKCGWVRMLAYHKVNSALSANVATARFAQLFCCTAMHEAIRYRSVPRIGRVQRLLQLSRPP